MLKVSVIIPAYNVDKYIEKCISSIMSQTLRDIEIIVVNDGSSDNTRTIVEEMEKKDNRIKLINKKNGGVLAARGTGVKVAQGKYVLYVDGDDWIEATCCEKMYNAIEEANADMAICDFYETYKHKNMRGTGGKFTVVNNEEYYRLFLVGDICCYLWTRLIKRELLNNVDYSKKISLGDDTYIILQMIDKIQKVIKIDEPLINYRVRENSITKKYDESIYNIWVIIELLKEQSLYKSGKYKKETDMFIFNHVFIGRVVDKVNHDKKIHKDMYNRFRKENINIYKNKYYIANVSNKNKLLTRVYLINYSLGVILANLIYKIQRLQNKKERFEK